MHKAFLCLLGSLICAGVVASDSFPTEGAVSVDGWGEVIDPDGGCRVNLEGKVLQLQIGTGPRLLDSENGGLMNSPRLVQSIDGDFAIQVVVDGNLPLPDPTKVEERAYIGVFHGGRAARAGGNCLPEVRE